MRSPLVAALAIALLALGCHGRSNEAGVSPTGPGVATSDSVPAPSATLSASASPSTPVPAALDGFDALPMAKPGSAGASCGSLTALGDSDVLPLLDGRLRVRSVKGASVSPLPHSIMGAPDAPADRSRVYYEAGSAGLAIVATERFQTVGPSFVEEAKKALALPDTELVRVETGDPSLRLLARMPTATPDGSSGTAFLLEGYVVQPDGTIQYLQIGTFPGEFTSVPGCRALALRIAKTLTAGPRALETAAGERTFELLRKRFHVTVPKGWVLTVQPGPDFDTARVRELAVYPDPAPIVGMTLTHDPQSPPDGPTTSRAAKVLGAAVDWKLSTVTNHDGDQVFVARVALPLDGLTLDIWSHSLNEPARSRAMGIAESLSQDK